jgi:hypothetical protein
MANRPDLVVGAEQVTHTQVQRFGPPSYSCALSFQTALDLI